MSVKRSPAGEPTPAALRNPLRRYWLATRPTFLLASLLPVLIGAASAWSDGNAPQLGLLLLSLFGVGLIHAGANVLNDFYDAQVGKRHWVVRLGPRRAAWGYLLLVLAAHLLLCGMLLWGGISPWLGLALLGAPLSLLGAARLLLLAERPGELGGAIRLSLAALFAHGLLLLLGLLLS